MHDKHIKPPKFVPGDSVIVVNRSSVSDQNSPILVGEICAVVKGILSPIYPLEGGIKGGTTYEYTCRKASRHHGDKFVHWYFFEDQLEKAPINLTDDELVLLNRVTDI